MTVDKMLALTDGFLADVEPLYEQLHTWAKYTLADRYGAEPHAGKIPAHWLPNRWGQNWPGLVSGIDMDGPFKAKTEGVHHRAGRAVLRLARVPEAAEVVLREVRPLPGRPEVGPEEEQPRLAPGTSTSATTSAA